jgi:hypothetical protein
MKRTELKRKTSMPPRVSRIPRVNRQRREKEFAREYGSDERVKWIKKQRCIGCGGLPSENAHTVTGGMGRKADANTIVPLCGDEPLLGIIGCHTKYDRHLAPFNNEAVRAYIKSAAAEVERRWRAHLAEDAA